MECCQKDVSSSATRITGRTRTILIFSKSIKTANILVRCLLYALPTPSETYHHWGVFAPTPRDTGVCITFNKALLLNCLGHLPIKCGNVRYKQIKEVRNKKPRAPLLPFIKRWPYRHEMEF